MILAAQMSRLAEHSLRLQNFGLQLRILAAQVSRLAEHANLANVLLYPTIFSSCAAGNARDRTTGPAMEHCRPQLAQHAGP